jgi:hypothetical protein
MFRTAIANSAKFVLRNMSSCLVMNLPGKLHPSFRGHDFKDRTWLTGSQTIDARTRGMVAANRFVGQSSGYPGNFVRPDPGPTIAAKSPEAIGLHR